ncbi:unnamed protein product [Sphagnum balticum]
MQASADLLLLGQFHYAELLGAYGAAMKILSIPMGVVFALMSTVYPKLAKHSHDFKSESLLTLMGATTRLIWVFVVPMVVGTFFFGDQLILWFFGQSYQASSAFLTPLSIAMAFFFLGLPPMVAILLSHNVKLMMKTSGLNLSVSFLCSFFVLLGGKPLLLPWAMVFSQGFFLVFTWLPFGKAGYFDGEDLRSLTLGAFLMAGGLLLPVSPALKFSAAVAGYLLGLAFSKIWRRPWIKLF